MDLTEAVRVYECDADGWVGTERRCETCNKFVSSRDEDGCESCFAEVEEVEVVTDHDGTVIRAEDYEPNGKSLAERQKAEFEKAKKESAKKAKVALQNLLSETTETTWGEVSVGQQIVAKDWKGNLDAAKTATVLSINVTGENSVAPVIPGSLIVLTEHYGLRLAANSADEVVLIKNVETAPVAVESADQRFIVEQGDDTHGTGVKFISANVGLAATDQRNVYIGEISGKNSEHSGFQTTIAAFFQPEEARAFARVARETAADLRSRILVDETAEVDVAFTEDDDDIISHVPTRYATFRIGKDDMMGGDGVRVLTATSGRSTQSFAVLSPNVLDGIAKAAELVADKLSILIDSKEK
jgi:hypothetical protein